jgi:hypothetical protein
MAQLKSINYPATRFCSLADTGSYLLRQPVGGAHFLDETRHLRAVQIGRHRVAQMSLPHVGQLPLGLPFRSVQGLILGLLTDTGRLATR